MSDVFYESMFMRSFRPLPGFVSFLTDALLPHLGLSPVTWLGLRFDP
jgi:hypothetical protein